MDSNPLQPAFPRDHRHDGHNGMTLRDYFAAKAMPLAFQYWRECTNGVNGDFVFARTADEGEMDLMAVDCYAMADAMLAARRLTHPAPTPGPGVPACF